MFFFALAIDKKAACEAVERHFKVPGAGTLLECNIDCCTGENCNGGGKERKIYSWLIKKTPLKMTTILHRLTKEKSRQMIMLFSKPLGNNLEQ